MIFSPKRRTLLLRVTTRTPLTGLGRAPPKTSLHSPAEGWYTSVEARTSLPKWVNHLMPPVTRNTCKSFKDYLFRITWYLYPFIILGNITGTSMRKPSSFESRAEVLYPPLLPIPGHSGAGAAPSSSHQHCICVRVWYWACHPVMWRWSANVTSYLSLTMSYTAEEMICWIFCYHVEKYQ